MLDRCPMCPGGHNVVAGNGPACSDYMFCFEAPGSDEDKKRTPVVGKIGQEFDQQYLPLSGLHRGKVYVTNVIKCLPPGDGKLAINDKAHTDLAKSCAEFHLYEEIRRVNPKVIVLGGAFANSLVPDINLDLHHGIPFEWQVPGAGTRTIFPMWSPSHGMFDHKMIGKLRTDFIRLRKFLANQLVVPIDEFIRPDYDVITDEVQLDAILGHRNTPIAIDTETTRMRKAFCLTFSVEPGTGYLIRAEDADLLSYFNGYVSQWLAEILLHNRLFDVPILGQMTVQLPRNKIMDTMMRVYHLQNMPQGLKVLAYRLLGMEMEDFDDLVSPYSSSKVLGYFADATAIKWPKPEPFLDRDKDGKWHYHQPQTLNTKLKRFFTDYGKNPNKDIFGSWEKWLPDHEQVQAVLGPYPGKCITHVPFDKALHYACRDADATLRLWPIIKRALQRQRRQPDYAWWEEAA